MYYYVNCTHVCVLPNEQLCDALFDSTVCVSAFANVFDSVNCALQLIFACAHFRQLAHHDNFITVVQCSRVPRQVAVTLMTTVVKNIKQ